MTEGLDRRTEAIIGLVFLGGMVISLILAVQTFEGTPTVILLVVSLVFLAVSLFFLSGQRSGSASGAGGANDDQSQQQSVVLGNGRTVSQSSSGQAVYTPCPECGTRVSEDVTFCPDCGAQVA